MKKLTMRTCESTSPASLLVIKILILTLHEQTKIRLNEHSEKTEQEIASSMHDSLMTEAVLQQMKDIRYTLNKAP